MCLLWLCSNNVVNLDESIKLFLMDITRKKNPLLCVKWMPLEQHVVNASRPYWQKRSQKTRTGFLHQCPFMTANHWYPVDSHQQGPVIRSIHLKFIPTELYRQSPVVNQIRVIVSQLSASLCPCTRHHTRTLSDLTSRYTYNKGSLLLGQEALTTFVWWWAEIARPIIPLAIQRPVIMWCHETRAWSRRRPHLLRFWQRRHTNSTRRGRENK